MSAVPQQIYLVGTRANLVTVTTIHLTTARRLALSKVTNILAVVFAQNVLPLRNA